MMFTKIMSQVSAKPRSLRFQVEVYLDNILIKIIYFKLVKDYNVKTENLRLCEKASELSSSHDRAYLVPTKNILFPFSYCWLGVL